MTLVAGISKVRLESSGTDVVVTSSGALSVTLSTAGGGAGSTSVNLVGSAGFAPVTSSAGLATVVTSGFVSITSGLVSVTSGTVTLSSAPLVVVASSGGTQLVQSTAATNPWS